MSGTHSFSPNEMDRLNEIKCGPDDVDRADADDLRERLVEFEPDEGTKQKLLEHEDRAVPENEEPGALRVLRRAFHEDRDMRACIARQQEELEYAAGLLEHSEHQIRKLKTERNRAKSLLNDAVQQLHDIMWDRLDYKQAEIHAGLREYREFLHPTGGD